MVAEDVGSRKKVSTVLCNSTQATFCLILGSYACFLIVGRHVADAMLPKIISSHRPLVAADQNAASVKLRVIPIMPVAFSVAADLELFSANLARELRHARNRVAVLEAELRTWQNHSGELNERIASSLRLAASDAGALSVVATDGTNEGLCDAGASHVYHVAIENATAEGGPVRAARLVVGCPRVSTTGLLALSAAELEQIARRLATLAEEPLGRTAIPLRACLRVELFNGDAATMERTVSAACHTCAPKALTHSARTLHSACQGSRTVPTLSAQRLCTLLTMICALCVLQVGPAAQPACFQRVREPCWCERCRCERVPERSSSPELELAALRLLAGARPRRLARRCVADCGLRRCQHGARELQRPGARHRRLIRAHQWPSEVIRRHQWPSKGRRSHQWSPEATDAIRSHQWS